jgi:RNA polymerase sigma-70 factor (ECF subfamily)
MLLRQRRTKEPLLKNSAGPEEEHTSVDVADDGPTPEEILWESERRTTLHKAIAKLRQSLKVVVQHRELRGLTTAETAAELGLTESAVKARIFHARKFLKKYLERKFAGTGVHIG